MPLERERIFTTRTGHGGFLPLAEHATTFAAKSEAS